MKDQDNQFIKRNGFLLAHSFADPVHNQSFYCFETVIRQCVLVVETIHSFSSQEAPRSRIPIPSEGKLQSPKGLLLPRDPTPTGSSVSQHHRPEDHTSNIWVLRGTSKIQVIEISKEKQTSTR